jgi:hypothetical protein
MKLRLQMLVCGAVIFASCAGPRLSSQEAREKIAEIGTSELVPDAIEIRRIVSQTENEAIAESTITLAFQFKRNSPADDWEIAAVRLGDRDWVDMTEILAAINEGRRRDTVASLQKVAAGIDGYRKTTGSMPAARDIVGLTDILHPLYMNELVREDGWGEPINFEVTGMSSFRLVSKGADGIPGTTDDIVVDGTASVP